jgi:hypothetical protein
MAQCWGMSPEVIFLAWREGCPPSIAVVVAPRSQAPSAKFGVMGTSTQRNGDFRHSNRGVRL